MLAKVINLLVFLAVFLSHASYGQSLIRCKDSTAYFATSGGDGYAVVKVPKATMTTDDKRVIVVNNSYALQAVLLPRKDYIEDGVGDLQVLSNYILSETQFFSEVYKDRLSIKMDPAVISTDKKAVVWYFDIPVKVQSQAQSATPAVRQLFASMVINQFVYSIATTQFYGQQYEQLKTLLSEIISSVKVESGVADEGKICK